RMLTGEELPAGERGGDGLVHLARGMPEDRRPHAERVVDEAVAVEIEEMRALAALEADRHRRAGEPDVRVDGAGDEPAGLLVVGGGGGEGQGRGHWMFLTDGIEGTPASVCAGGGLAARPERR